MPRSFFPHPNEMPNRAVITCPDYNNYIRILTSLGEWWAEGYTGKYGKFLEVVPVAGVR